MLKNQLLQQAQAKIEAGVTDKARYDRLLSAGVKTIYDKAMFQKLSQSIAQSQTPIEDVAKGIVAVLNMMAHKARGSIPHDVLLQAGMALMLDALDFVEQAGIVQIDEKALDTATQEFIEAVLPSVGLTAQKMEEALGSVKGAMGDPQKMAQYQASAGGEQ